MYQAAKKLQRKGLSAGTAANAITCESPLFRSPGRNKSESHVNAVY